MRHTHKRTPEQVRRIQRLLDQEAAEDVPTLIGRNDLTEAEAQAKLPDRQHPSLRSHEPTVADRLREWDDAVEDGENDDENASRKPFDAGLVLVSAAVLDAYAAVIREEPDAGRRLAQAMSDLRETAEEIVS